MNKAELVEAVARQMGSSKAEAERALVAVTACVAAGLKGGGEVSIQGFGSFRVTRRSARDTRNPRTGALIHVPARKGIGFRAGKALRDAI